MKTGKIPESVLKRSVLRQIQFHGTEAENGAGVGEDCAVFAFEDGEKITACVSVFTEEPESAGVYAVYGAVNNLAAKGARTRAILVSVMLPPDTPEERLKALMKQVGDTAETLGVTVAGGHTQVSELVRAPILSVTGIGTLRTSGQGKAKPGQDIVMTKWAGLAGTVLIAKKKREQLLSRYPAHLIDDAEALERYLSVASEAAIAGKSGAATMHDASRGGIFAALWELAEKSGVGLEIDLGKIPIRQETVEISNETDVNPYELYACGSLLIAADNGYDLASKLQKERIHAAVIGKTTDSNDRVVINQEERRFLEPPKSDEIHKVLDIANIE